MLLQRERELVVEYGKKLSESGLCPGTSGNLSILDREHMLMAISPSGMDYCSLTAEDIVVAGLDARLIDGKRKPSSEWALHAEFYRARPEVNAVVHTHSLYCTTFAVLGQPVKAVHFAIAEAGTSEVPCAPYALFGTAELAEAAVRECGNANAVLLANHGIVCCGPDIKSAYSLACNMEYTARLQYQAMCIGTPQIIPDDDMAAVINRFRCYGQR